MHILEKEMSQSLISSAFLENKTIKHLFFCPSQIDKINEKFNKVLNTASMTYHSFFYCRIVGPSKVLQTTVNWWCIEMFL